MTAFSRLFLILILIVTASCGEKQTKKKSTVTNEVLKEPVSDWKPLFNGQNLEGWTMKINSYPLGENFGNTFRVEEGILKIRYDQYGPQFNDRFGALFYNKELKNYRLRAEYRFVGETAPGAPEWGYRDSGVQIHTQNPETVTLNQQFPICLEYNLHGGNGTDERPLGAICGIGMHVSVDGKPNTEFCNPAKVSKTFHGDQWVTIEIDIKDGHVTHYVNGEEIMNYSDPIYNPENEYAKAFIKDGEKEVTSGYISLQSNSHPIDFRKIELLEY